MSQATVDDTVTIHFEARLTDGTVVAASKKEEPIQFVIGSGTLIPGVESAVEGMSVGERKSVQLASEDAFGPFHDELVVTLPKEEFPATSDVAVGMQFTASGGNGTERVVTVVDISDDSVVVDGNHPLAGKDIEFDLELVAIH